MGVKIHPYKEGCGNSIGHAERRGPNSFEVDYGSLNAGPLDLTMLKWGSTNFTLTGRDGGRGGGRKKSWTRNFNTWSWADGHDALPNLRVKSPQIAQRAWPSRLHTSSTTIWPLF